MKQEFVTFRASPKDGLQDLLKQNKLFQKQMQLQHSAQIFHLFLLLLLLPSKRYKLDGEV